jgi:hypothetical protein
MKRGRQEKSSSKKKPRVGKSQTKKRSVLITDLPIPTFGSEIYSQTDLDHYTLQNLRAWARSRGLTYTKKDKPTLLRMILDHYDKWRREGGLERDEDEPTIVERTSGVRYLSKPTESVASVLENAEIVQNDQDLSPEEGLPDLEEPTHTIGGSGIAENIILALTKEVKSLKKNFALLKAQTQKDIDLISNRVGEINAFTRNEVSSLSRQVGVTENEVTQISNEIFEVHNRLVYMDLKFHIAFSQ